VIGPDSMRDVTAEAGRRLHALDRLLPAARELPAGCGLALAATDSAGRVTAVACCEHWTAQPGSLDLTWGAARRFRLTPMITGHDHVTGQDRVTGQNSVAESLDQLLTQWREHLADVEDAAQGDSGAVVIWPSRDVEGVLTLQRHGLIPLSVIAARTAGSAPARSGHDAAIRRAGPDDADVVTALGLELVRYDNYFGEVVERPETGEGLREASVRMLAGPQPWVWLAERDGIAVGLLATEPPPDATWIAPLTGPAPVAYLQQGVVLPGQRGAGVGARLVERYHAEADAAGVAVTLLHYSQVNPLSAPFWSQQGYRPLWTTWETRPARTLR
jgi:GNAT superfamily N-acetyltransferase